MKKILIVDDSREIRELVIATLETEEYKVFEASDGAKAIATALMEKPDFIIMDVMLPGLINGIDATRTIKTIPLQSIARYSSSQAPMIKISGKRGLKRERAIFS